MVGLREVTTEISLHFNKLQLANFVTLYLKNILLENQHIFLTMYPKYTK